MRTVMILSIIVLSVGLAFAGGSVEDGKRLFNDQTLGGSTNAKSCNTCHPGGKGLERAGTKKYTSLMGISATSLEDIVNICIARPLGGKKLAHDSQEMKDIVSYIKSLGK